MYSDQPVKLTETQINAHRLLDEFAKRTVEQSVLESAREQAIAEGLPLKQTATDRLVGLDREIAKLRYRIVRNCK